MDLTSPYPFRHQRTVHMPKPLEISVSPIQEQSVSSGTSHTNRTSDDENPSQSTPVPPSLHLDISSYVMDLSQNENEFDQPSPDSNTQISTSFFRPRSPLPPTKLANIANALGVNTPMPAAYIRSPSPSTFRSPSRFLLHIVPPPFLPSDDDDDTTLFSSPNGANAVSINSYRSQFRRGTLIPLYPTLRSQLGAIAREYSLPSTGGLVLYLSQTAPDGTSDGPQISDEVWKLLWYRALMAERQEQLGIGATSRAPSSLALRSVSGPGNLTPSSATPFNFDREFSSSLSSLSTTPTPTSSHVAYPSDAPSDTDTSTTTSTTSNPSPSTTTTTTGFTSLDNDSTHTRTHPDLLAIASDLTPNPFLPILAKVEFDIDLRKAKWYDGWLKARKERAKWKANANANTTANNPNSRTMPLPLELPDLAKSRSRLDSHTPSDDDRESERGRAIAIERIGYALLDDGDGDVNRDSSPDSVEKVAVGKDDTNANANANDDDDDNDDTQEVDATVRMRLPSLEGGAGSKDGDPLADVFGTDADTWAAMRHEAPGTRKKKPRDLALIIGDEEVADRDGTQNGLVDDDGDDEGEVLKIWNDHRKPTLKLNGGHRYDGMGSGSTSHLAPRKPAPPPLKIAPLSSSSSIVGTTGAVHSHNFQNGPRSAFPVMQRSFSEASIGESVNEKRMKHHTGIVFGDGKGLGFGNGLRAGKIVEEPAEFYEGEGDRSSQIIMKQKLDILEKQLAQLTPRKLSTASPPLPPLPSVGLSPTEKLSGSSSPSPRREKDASSMATTSPSPSPSASPRRRLSVHKRGRSSMSSTSSSSRSHLEHQLHQQAVTHGLHISKGSKGLITPPPPLNSTKSIERTPPHLTIRPASDAVSVPSRNSESGSGFDKSNNGNGYEIDDGQELVIVPPMRISSSSSAPNGGAPSNKVPDSPPLLPLSPDPFGRRDLGMGDDSRISESDLHSPLLSLPPSASTSIDPSSLEAQEVNNNTTLQSIAMTLEMSPNEKQSSRFSADSEQSIEAAVNNSNSSKQLKRPRSNSIMSVRGLRNLWRKSSAAASSVGPGGSGSGPNSNSSSSSLNSSSSNGSRSANGYGIADLPPLPAMPPLPPVNNFGLPTPPSSGLMSPSPFTSGSTTPGSTLSQHSRQESLASVKSLPRLPPSAVQQPLPPASSTSSQPQPQSQPQLRPRRPSASPIPRPDSGSDPFQFDSVLYKSPSTPSLLNGNGNGGAGSGFVNPTAHRPGNSSVSSKGILKNWAGSAVMDSDIRRTRVVQQQSALGLRRPSESRPESTASAASSASDSRKSVPSPPPSPPKIPRRSTSQSRLLQLQFEPPLSSSSSSSSSSTTPTTTTNNSRASLNGSNSGITMPHSLPTGSLLGSSRFNEFSGSSSLSSSSQSQLASINSLTDESFEVIPSRRLTPSASYSGVIL